MDDRLKETLSAMMDDEADELSVRRLLSHDGQEDVCTQFQRWQRMRDLIQRRHPAIQSVDVSEGVRDRLEGHEPVADQQALLRQPEGRRWQWPVAAMVALVVGFGVGAGWDSGPVPLESQAAADIPALSLEGMNAQQRQQLNQYLLQHAQYNSFGVGQGSLGYARAVSASGAGR